MPKIKYLDLPIVRNVERMAIVSRANQIIAAFRAQGYTLTLRQLYYQFVAHDYFPDNRAYRNDGGKWKLDPDGTKNAEPNYSWLGDIVNDARLAGLIDWNAIEDRTRGIESLAHWSTPDEIVGATAEQYRIDKWKNQPNRVEVWIEKEALAGVFERTCKANDVPYLSCRGYTSQSEMWRAGQRLKSYVDAGQRPVILHFGDHDPSGIDMTRDIRDRLELFTGGAVKLDRLALNMEQVEEHNPPPNPAKVTDSRAKGYIREFGGESWELDALEPALLEQLARDAILELRDNDQWEKDEEAERDARGNLKLVADRFDDAVSLLENNA